MSNYNKLKSAFDLIFDQQIQKNIIKYLENIAILSQDSKNYDIIADLLNGENMQKYTTHENIEYVRTFYKFLASMPPVPIKDKLQELIENMTDKG